MRGSSKNEDLLAEFSRYCYDHPGERFWQALKNWSDYAFIMAGDLEVKLPEGLYESHPFTVQQALVLAESLGLKDTYNKEGK